MTDQTWNQTSNGYPTHDKPVLVSNGGNITCALAVWNEYDGESGWLWEAFVGGPIDDIDSYECDDEYQFDFWMDMPALPGES